LLVHRLRNSVLLSMNLGTRILIAVVASLGLLALLFYVGLRHMFGGAWTGESFGYGGFLIGFLVIVCFVIFSGEKE